MTIGIQIIDADGRELTPVVFLPREPRPFDTLDLDGQRFDLLDEPARIGVRRVGPATRITYQLRGRRVDGAPNEQ